MTTANRRSEANTGFTLVEVMVALAVAGMVVAAAYAGVSAVADARGRTEAARQAFAGPAARAALEGWLRAAAPVEGAGPFRGEDRRSGALERDALSFGVEDGGALHPGPRRIRLWVESGAGLLAEVAPLRSGSGDPVDTLAVAPAAAGLALRYRTRVEGFARWVDGWRMDSVMPEAVELRVLPALEAAADPEAGGLPRALRLPLVTPIREAPDAGA